MRLFSVGHSNLALPALVALLREHGIEHVSDVRAFPRSRRYPHFDQASLAVALPDAGIAYLWLGRELGGHRTNLLSTSPHNALDENWRPYADHMGTAEFRTGIARLRDATGVFLCAERDWQHCHRRHIADYLVAIEGIEVLHLPDRRPHVADSRARIVAGGLVYDRGQADLF